VRIRAVPAHDLRDDQAASVRPATAGLPHPVAPCPAQFQALRARKVPVEYMMAANEGHSLAHRETQIAFCSPRRAVPREPPDVVA
jgi:hypothetical protein